MKKGVDFIGITVVYFCHDGRGKFIMAKRSKQARDEHGRWDIGGGGVEFGDDVIGRLKTEIMEEYCTDVISHEFLGYRDVHRQHDGQSTHWIALDFKVLVDPAKVSLGEPHKFSEIRWFTLEALPPKEDLHSQLPLFLKDYHDLLCAAKENVK